MRQMKLAATVRCAKILDQMGDSFYINGACPAKGATISKAITRYSRNNVGVFAVADGIGQSEAAAEASYKTVAKLKKYHEKFAGVPYEQSGKIISQYLDDVNGAISSMGSAGPGGPAGASLAMLIINQGVATAVNVGNARVYSFRYGRLGLMTQDHTEASRLLRTGAIRREEAAKHPSRGLLTRYVGSAVGGEILEPYISVPTTMEKDDAFLICSNGLTDALSEERMSYILSLKMSDERLVQRLVGEAIARGADDNITVMIVRKGGKKELPSALKFFLKLAVAVSLAAVLTTFVLSAFKGCTNINNAPDTHEASPEPTPTPPLIRREA